jgi:putative two-component system hydrogenase maturation factor HypX/HoxX
LFLTSAHNCLSQRAFIELRERGHEVSIELALSDELMFQAAESYQPDLIIAPMLKKAIPEGVWRKWTCFIVHPGIKGDRGPSSLDWAILEGASEWGVTILQANAEMDAGDIWATGHFAMRAANKSSLYRDEVVQAASRALLVAVQRFESGSFRAEPLDYSRPDVRGTLRPSMKQQDRAIDWTRSSQEIARRIRSADGSPGVLDTILGETYYCFGAHEEDLLHGPAGAIIARREGAICRATGDGALWITHLKKKSPDSPMPKLPATRVLGERLARVPESPLHFAERVAHRTYREIVYEEANGVGHLWFDIYNGAMSTESCLRLLDAVRYAKARATQVLVLWGGRDCFSNGIDLNAIEAAAKPEDESWANIQAIDDVVLEILRAEDQWVVSALRSGAGAGGVILGLAADQVLAREGIVLNPHYKGMGNLYGSEYWTYLLPRRVGAARARALTESLLPVGTAGALRIQLIDRAIGATIEEFEKAVTAQAEELARSSQLAERLRAKRERLAEEEQRRPLSLYRDEELAQMRENFYGPDRAYHVARKQFVYKTPPTETPRHLALHRATDTYRAPQRVLDSFKAARQDGR